MSTFKMLSTSLFYLDFISITWTSYKTRTNLLIFNFKFPLILCYFPQQFLYFLPLPHVLAPRILLVFIVFIILSVFVGVTRQCTFGIYRIFSIYNIYNIHIPMSNRCHWHPTNTSNNRLFLKQFIYLTFIYLLLIL